MYDDMYNDDPLTPGERAKVNAIIEHLIDNGEAFVCGICEHVIDSRFALEHAKSHD